jgi:glycerate-2-kinase
MWFKNWKQVINNGQTPELKKIRGDIIEILSSAVDAVDPYKTVKSKFKSGKIIINEREIDCSNFENIYLLGFGKASVGMTQAVCDSIKIKKGLVITNDPDKCVQNKLIKTYVGGHPIPNQNSIHSTEKILELIRECKKNDIIIILVSGGGSSLLCKPKIKLEDFKLTTELLLKSGANINEINTVRKHLSFVKGGQLVRHAKCMVVSFIISDIVNDPVEFIASGPTSPDSTTYFDAKNILLKYSLWKKIPSDVRREIMNGISGSNPETPKMNDTIFNNVHNFIIANNKIACKAAEIKAIEIGYKPIITTTSLIGEAKDVGRYLIEKIHKNNNKSIYISGGETTVTIKGNGKGGRNQEMILGSIKSLDGKNIVFSSFATDGIDGDSKASGAIADGFSLMRAKNKNLNIEKYLEDNNSYEFFYKLGDLFITGPTGTNVMDIQIIIS